MVHYGDSQPLQACLHSILEDPSPVHREIAVADNSANLAVSDLPTGVRYLPLPENPGFGAGLHRALESLEKARREEQHPPFQAYILLNHDVCLAPGYLSAAICALYPEESEAPSQGQQLIAAAAGPLYLDESKTQLWYAGGSVRPLLGIVQQSRNPQDALRPRDVSFLTGAALAVNPRIFATVGGFDEGIFLYNEDLDLSLRWIRGGYRLRFAPRLIATHRLGSATGSAQRSALYLEEITASRFRPFRPFLLRLWLACLHSAYLVLRILRLWAPPNAFSMSKTRALLRGYRRALAKLHHPPRVIGSDSLPRDLAL
ncbi:MAG: glycosyltransferase family 2 protein [Acidobacteriota bacterium]